MKNFLLIKSKIKSRLSRNGHLRKQIREMHCILQKHKKSDYARSVYKALFIKYFFGSKIVNYSEIFNEAWNEILTQPKSDIIEIGGFKYLNKPSFKREYTDIFLAGGIIDKLNFDNDKRIACEILSLLSAEGPYENNEVKINKNDIVIDAGAHMGLFSIFCAYKEVKKVYAFEPQKLVQEILNNNIHLNSLEDKVQSIFYGISDRKIIKELFHSFDSTAGASTVLKRNDIIDSEKVQCIDLDSWVIENNIPRIDFIKADIEGAERELLLGATKVLKEFYPRLAICTYHLPDDPKILKEIILNANSEYKIYQTSHKLYALVQQ